MKKYIALLLLVLILTVLSGCGDIPRNADNSSSITDTTSDDISNDTSEPIVEAEEKIYEDNESIQKFITVYNKLYPDATITKDMLTKYHHHGSTHDDQVKFYIGDYEILLSDTTGYFSSDGYKASVYIDNIGNSNDGIKALFFKFMRVYDSTLTDETLDEYWSQQIDSSSNIDDFGEVECYTTAGIDNHIVQFTKLDGKFLSK